MDELIEAATALVYRWDSTDWNAARAAVVLIGFVGGVFVGAGFCIILNAHPSSYAEKAQLAVEQCETALPRNETCVITAEPALAADKETP